MVLSMDIDIQPKLYKLSGNYPVKGFYFFNSLSQELVSFQRTEYIDSEHSISAHVLVNLN